MKVRDVMTTEVRSLLPSASYGEAARIMVENNFSGLPIVDTGGNLIGIVSEKDLFRALYPIYDDFIANPELYADHERREGEIDALRSTPIERYMTAKVITISPDAPIMKAGGLMLAHHIHRLPVVDDGKVVGIVTREDIYCAILLGAAGKPALREAARRAANG